MTTPKEQLMNLANAIVEDIMSLNDEEVMAEAMEDLGSPDAVEAETKRLKAMIERLVPSEET